MNINQRTNIHKICNYSQNICTNSILPHRNNQKHYKFKHKKFSVIVDIILSEYILMFVLILVEGTKAVLISTMNNKFYIWGKKDRCNDRKIMDASCGFYVTFCQDGQTQ
eukprot:159634_1